jgi:hypothetical protein
MNEGADKLEKRELKQTRLSTKHPNTTTTITTTRIIVIMRIIIVIVTRITGVITPVGSQATPPSLEQSIIRIPSTGMITRQIDT